MKVLDLFSGVGMFAYGMEKAGHEVIAFCEIEEWPRRVLDKHWPDVPKYADVKELNRERLEADGVTGIEIITGGFPCQDLSFAGRQEGISGERSGLFGEIIRLASELRPRYIILENVTALLTGESGEWMRSVLGAFATLGGYEVEWHAIPAAHAGAPHLRDRVWIIARSLDVANTRDHQRRHGIGGGAGRDGEREDDQAIRTPETVTPTGSGTPPETVAYPKRQRQQGQGQSVEPCNPASNQDRQAGEPVHVRERNVRSTEPSMGLLADGIASRLAGSGWLPEPRVGRVATGVPDRVHKLKALGNGLVWQIPYAIGRAINGD